MNDEIPKIIYHGSPFLISDGVIRANPGHINQMRTPVTAVFATHFSNAYKYAIMHAISGNGWKSPCYTRGICLEKVATNFQEKVYVYELDSDGFNRDGEHDYYSFTDRPIKDIIEIDVRREIKKHNIKIYVLKEKIDFRSMPDQQSAALWNALCHDLDNFELYNDKIIEMDTLARMAAAGRGIDK